MYTTPRSGLLVSGGAGAEASLPDRQAPCAASHQRRVTVMLTVVAVTTV